MELTIEVARRVPEGREPEVLHCAPVDVEGLDSSEQLAQPLFIRIHLRMTTDQPETGLLADARGSETPDGEGILDVSDGQIEPVEPEPPGPDVPVANVPAPPEPASAESVETAAVSGRPMGPGSDSPVLDLVEEAVKPAPEDPGAAAAESETAPLPALAATDDGPLLQVEDAPVPDTAVTDISEFQQKVAAAAGSLGEAEVTSVTIRQEGIGSMMGAGGGAQRLLDPKPVPKEPPGPTEANPVPRAMWLIDRATVDATGKTQLLLSKIDLPKIEESPQRHLPKRGDHAIPEGEFAAVLKFGKDYQKKADDFSKQFDDPVRQMSVNPRQSLVSSNGLTPEEEHVRDVYDKLKNPPKPPPEPKSPAPKSPADKPNPFVIESKAEPLVLPPLRPEHPENKAQDAAQREAVAQTFARLLAQPDQTAYAALTDIANMIAPGGVVHRKFPDLGIRKKPVLQAELDKNFRDMALQAGASEELLNKAVGDRKRELDEKARGLRTNANSACYADARGAAQQAGSVTSNVDATAQGLSDRAKTVADAAAQMTPTQKAEAKRDELITKAREKASACNARFGRMKESRKTDIGKARGEYLNAYRYAEQQDELTIREKPKLQPEQRQDEITASMKWLKDNTAKISSTFDAFDGTADTETTGLTNGVNTAAAQAFKEIREWAAAKTGQTRTNDETQKQATADWAALKQANIDVWKALENRKAASVANYYIDFYVETRDKKLDAAAQTAMLGDKKLGQEKRMIASAFFGKSGDDPLDIIAKGIRDRFMEDKRETLRPELRIEMLGSPWWRELSDVGSAIGPTHASMEDRAKQIHDVGLHGGIFGRNEVPKVMGALTGLNDMQMNALEKAYLELYKMSLDYDLRDQLDAKGEYDRALDLIKLAGLSDKTGKEAEEARAEAKASAAAGELYAAGEGKVGTDEDAIFRVLRSLSKEDRERVERIYKDRYGWTLSEALADEMSANEAAIGEALRVGDKDKANAIAVDEALHFKFWGANREDVEKVYTDMRDEVREEARRYGRDSEWVRVETKRRAEAMEKVYDKEIAGQAIIGYQAYSDDGEARPYVRPKLRDSYGKLFDAADSDVLTALADGDESKADTARIEAERRSFVYVSDNKINDVLMAQYDRAHKDEELDSGRALRYLEEQRMKNDEDRDFKTTGRFWTPEHRYDRQQQLELNVERALESRAQIRAGENMRSLAATYETKYPGQTLQAVITDHVGGNAQTAAQAMLDQGYLSPYQRLRYGIEGLGTKEKLVKDTLRGRTKAEIDELDRLWQLDHPGETLLEALSGDLSGDDWIEAQLAYQGRPMSIDEAVAAAKYKEELNRAGWLGRTLLGSEDAMVGGTIQELENLREVLRDPRNANLTPEEQQGLIDVFNGQREVVDSAIETRNTVMNQVTDSIVNVASIAVALVVGFVGSFFTGGLAGAVAIALIASILTTATSIGLRAALMGGHYGLEQLYVDLAVGVVDAIVAVLTAGMGNRLLGIRQVAVKGLEKVAEQGAKEAAKKTIFRSLRQVLAKQIGPLAERTQAIKFLEKMAAEEAAWYSKLAAHGISQALENTIQSIPSAIVGQALDKKNYEHGNALFNIVTGAGEQVAMGVAQGLALSAGQHIVGTGVKAAWAFARGPKLGAATYHRFAGTMAEPELEAHYKDYEQAHPGATHEEFQGVIERERARVNEKAAAQIERRQEFREQLNDALRSHENEALREMAGKLNDVPITQLSAAEYARVAGIGAPEVSVIIRDGQVHIVAREGASPASIRELAGHIATQVEPRTGGRVRDASAVLPKDLRGVVEIRTDTSLRPRQVEVRIQPKLEIVIGRRATAADIAGHVRTARAELRLEGARGRVMKMIEQIRLWTFEHGSAPSGTKAYEAHFEVQKLPGIIEARRLELANPELAPHERAHLEEQVHSLLRQLETHRATLDRFDLEPGRGFIAAEDIPELQRPYKEAMRENVEGYRRTPIDSTDAESRSPLHGKTIEGRGTVEKVNQVGETWHEWDPKTQQYLEYRLVEGLSGNKRIALYEETFNVLDRWSMRGEEINRKGTIGEDASKLQLNESIRRAREKGRPDFLVKAQTESGQGFDKVRIKFNEGDVVPKRGGGFRLAEGAKPTLVIGEDKLMAHVSTESITAIRENLIKNLRKLYEHVKSGTAVVPEADGGLGLTPFQAEALKAALKDGKFRFELRVFSEESLGSPKYKSELQQERMIVPKLEAEIKDLLDASKGKDSWMQGREVEVDRVIVGESYQKKARATSDAKNRLGEIPSVHERVLEMKLDPSNPEHLHQAYVSLIGQGADQPSAFRLKNPAYDPKTGLLFDTAGGGRAIHSERVQQAEAQTSRRSAQVAERIYAHLMSKPKTPGTGRVADPFVVLDLSGVSKNNREVLKRSLVRLFESRNQLGKLQKVLFITDQQPKLRPLISTSDVGALASSSPRK